ncbi:MAG TPA: hypothetical protein VMR75_02325, partial [Candidatus Saccharimonadales bacterium]|nr:hypothetical protein [Candidatus Saccharimonadales bacterium]
IVRMDSGDPDDYDGLFKALKQAEGGASKATRLLYLSVPPKVAGKITAAFAKVGLNKPPGITTRLLMEKPFGSDLASAEKLATQLHAAFAEEQIYRIDHYVAKTVAQNIALVRTGNPAVQGRWDSKYISRIEIDALEEIGIEGRADFYEQTGALRDLIQSHLLALLALTMMDLPTESGAAALHRERVKLLESVTPIVAGEIDRQAHRGQYEGYRKEVGNPNSHTETFARLNLELTAPGWHGVEVALTTGKGLSDKLSEIRVHFNSDNSGDISESLPGVLRFRLQPNEMIELERSNGIVEPIALLDTIPAVAGHEPDSYERVLLDAIAGDQTNFTCNDEVLATWQIIEPVLQAWLQSDEGLLTYPFGSDGPAFNGPSGF